MIRPILIFSLVVILFEITTNAQTDGAMNRSEIQSTRFQKQHMPQTEEMLINSLMESNPSKKATTIQNVRDLEFIYPEEPFNNFLAPLMKILKNENEIVQIRILAAIALDGLHSNTGDQAIENMSKTSGNQNVKELCSALLLK